MQHNERECWCGIDHSRAHDQVLVDRGCPVCGAPPGDFCHTPSGKPRSDHAGREYEEDADSEVTL